MTEIEMSSPINPMLQVGYCIAESRPGYAVTRRGEPIVIFGVTGTASGAGSPWLLATDAIKEYPIVFYRKSKDFIREMREMYDELENYVYCGNDLSIRWLGWAGFEFDEPQGDFMRFWWKRGDARCAQ